MAKPPAQPNQSLIDGLQVLSALAIARAPIGSRELARQLNLEPTRANRLLKTLASLGVARQTADRKYVSGPAMHVLSVQAIYGSGLLARAVPILQTLLRFNCAVAMGVLWQDQVCYLYHAQPGGDMSQALAVRGLFPAAESGIGIPLLAQLPATERARLCAHLSPAEQKRLAAQLHIFATKGYVHLPATGHRAEPALGVAIGAPAFAGLALAGPTAQVGATVMIQALQDAANQIAALPD